MPVGTQLVAVPETSSNRRGPRNLGILPQYVKSDIFHTFTPSIAAHTCMHDHCTASPVLFRGWNAPAIKRRQQANRRPMRATCRSPSPLGYPANERFRAFIGQQTNIDYTPTIPKITPRHPAVTHSREVSKFEADAMSSSQAMLKMSSVFLQGETKVAANKNKILHYDARLDATTYSQRHHLAMIPTTRGRYRS